MEQPGKDFFPEPIERASLDESRPNYRQLGEGVEVVVLVRSGGLSIFRDLCPHMGGSMSEGRYDAARGTLECPWHGYRYSADAGEFAENPNDKTFACLKGLYKSHKPEPPRWRLSQFSYVEKEGAVWVRRPRS